MSLKLQYWDKGEGLGTELIFNNMGLLMAFFKPNLPDVLDVNHWTVLSDLGVFGHFEVAHSQIGREELTAAMEANTIYKAKEIDVIRRLFLKEVDE